MKRRADTELEYDNIKKPKVYNEHHDMLNILKMDMASYLLAKAVCEYVCNLDNRIIVICNCRDESAEVLGKLLGSGVRIVSLDSGGGILNSYDKVIYYSKSVPVNILSHAYKFFDANEMDLLTCEQMNNFKRLDPYELIKKL
jgi:hypothetical protein